MIYIRVTLKSGCKNGKNVVRIVKFWVDDEGAHAKVLSGSSPEIPK